MQISSFVMQLTGLDAATLRNLVRFNVHEGVTTCTQWQVPNVPQPTQDQINAALAAPEPVLKPVLIAYAETVQGNLASAGTTVNVDPGASTAKNVFASTSTQGLTYLSGAVQFAQLNPNASVSWVNNGETINLTASEITTLAQGVYAYIQGTFAKLSAVTAQINSGSITTEVEIDNAFA